MITYDTLRASHYFLALTLGGLVVAMVMGVWGLVGMHWPTLWWLVQRPQALVWGRALLHSSTFQLNLSLFVKFRCGIFVKLPSSSHEKGLT